MFDKYIIIISIIINIKSQAGRSEFILVARGTVQKVSHVIKSYDYTILPCLLLFLRWFIRHTHTK